MAPPATACSIPTPPPPGGGPREKERQEDRCPELGPNLFLGRILTLLLHFLSGWILPCLTGVPSKPQSCLRLWGEVSPSCTHAHTHTHTHMHTHTYTLPACKCIFPSNHSQKKPRSLHSSRLPPPSPFSITAPHGLGFPSVTP